MVPIPDWLIVPIPVVLMLPMPDVVMLPTPDADPALEPTVDGPGTPVCTGRPCRAVPVANAAGGTDWMMMIALGALLRKKAP